jgi:excisionase family DNA binding protein
MSAAGSTDIITWEKRAAVSPAEAAELLGLSEATIFRLLRRGALASVLIGGSRRIPTTAIQKALAASSTPVAA